MVPWPVGRDGGLHVGDVGVVATAAAVAVKVFAVALVLVGVATGGEESGQEARKEGFGHGEAGADDSDVAFDCGPGCCWGVVVCCVV